MESAALTIGGLEVRAGLTRTRLLFLVSQIDSDTEGGEA